MQSRQLPDGMALNNGPYPSYGTTILVPFFSLNQIDLSQKVTERVERHAF
jgi:hypothetical protein